MPTIKLEQILILCMCGILRVCNGKSRVGTNDRQFGLTNRRVSPRTISWYLRPLGISLTRLITMSVWLIPLTDSTASLCRSWLRQVSLYNAANCETKMMSYYIWNWTTSWYSTTWQTVTLWSIQIKHIQCFIFIF